MRPYLLAAALAAATCSRPAPPPPEDARAPEPPLPRYWLRDAPLLGNPGGREVLHVTGPALVELLPDGRVRAVPGSAVTFEGYLPEELLREPHGTKGLMLYAQRLVELRADSRAVVEDGGAPALDHPPRPVIGRLHPGALVGVAPASEAEGKVGLPVYKSSGQAKAVVAYTDRAALGLEPREPPAWKPAGAGRALVIPWAEIHSGEPWSKESAAVPLSDCSDIWLPEAGHQQASQVVRGVELSGQFVHASVSQWWSGPRFPWAAGCPLRAISRRDDVLISTGPAKEAEVVPGVPPGYVPVMPAYPDQLEKLINDRRTVYWLQATSDGVVCKGWKFDHVRWDDETLRTRADLMGEELVTDHYQRQVHPWHPVTYWPYHGQMHLGWAHPDVSRGEHDLTLLSASDDELAVTALEVPDGIVAYDPADAERWFLSRSRCEVVQREVNAAIEADGSVTTRIGLHIPTF